MDAPGGVHAIVEAAVQTGAVVRGPTIDPRWSSHRPDRRGLASRCVFHSMSANDLTPLPDEERPTVAPELEGATPDGMTATLDAVLAFEGWLDQEP